MADEKKGKLGKPYAAGASGSEEHTEGGLTTKHDATDLGVPMAKGKADEPVGPEDAFGAGPKRGDYSGPAAETADNKEHYVMVPNADAGEDEPNVIAVRQNDLATQQGTVPKGEKGGVTTSEAEALVEGDLKEAGVE